MGLESANYTLNYGKIEASQLVRVVQNLGGQENSDAPTGARRFSIQGERYWIDLQWLAKSQTGQPVIFIRVALCNPLEVREHLKQLFDQLFKSGDALMTDSRSKLQWHVWNDRSWEELWSSYQQQRSEFRKTFGNYEAAISADKVFENLQKHGNEPN